MTGARLTGAAVPLLNRPPDKIVRSRLGFAECPLAVPSAVSSGAGRGVPRRRGCGHCSWPRLGVLVEKPWVEIRGDVGDIVEISVLAIW